MSLGKAFSEYVQMVKDGFNNRDKIIEAMQISAQVKNQAQGYPGEITNVALAEIIRRKDICAACPFNSREQKAKGNYNSSLPYEHCVLCRCRIGYEDSKEFCLSCTCGADAWNKEHPNSPPMEVRWTAFKQD